VSKETQVFISKFAEKQIKKLPKQISEALFIWVESIELTGIADIRKLKGYHDEPLKGDRKGQRSARLNRSYRVIYVENENKDLVLITVIEVNKHEY
jgi:proteic killer suppression protein